MARFTMTVENSETVATRLQVHIPEEIRQNVRVAINGIANDMAGQVKANLSGGVLKVRTGRLAGSLLIKRFDRDHFIGAAVGVNQDGYVGRFFEKGYDGSHSVREHVRATPKGSEATVRAYVRNVSGTRRPWLSPVLNSNRNRIRTELMAAIGQAMPEEM